MWKFESHIDPKSNFLLLICLFRVVLPLRTPPRAPDPLVVVMVMPRPSNVPSTSTTTWMLHVSSPRTTTVSISFPFISPLFHPYPILISPLIYPRPNFPIFRFLASLWWSLYPWPCEDRHFCNGESSHATSHWPTALVPEQLSRPWSMAIQLRRPILPLVLHGALGPSRANSDVRRWPYWMGSAFTGQGCPGRTVNGVLGSNCSRFQNWFEIPKAVSYSVSVIFSTI